MKISVFLDVATCGLGLYDITSHNTSRMLNLHNLFLNFMSGQQSYSSKCVTNTISRKQAASRLTYSITAFRFHFERWIITPSCYHDNDVTSRVTFIRSRLSTAILHYVTTDGFCCRHFTTSSGNCCKVIRSTALINVAVKEDTNTRWLHKSYFTK
jgi:hypothetical protein